MQFHRIRVWLVVFAVTIGTAAGARAQQQPDHNQEVQPFGPVDMGDLKGLQLFAPIPSNDMDRYPRGSTGPFFRYERLYWSIHQPSLSLVGSNQPDLVAAQVSNNTNQFISADFVWGNRFDIGYRLCDSSGWVTSIVKSNTEFSTAFAVNSTTSVGFSDPQNLLPENNTIFFVNNDLLLQGFTPFLIPPIPILESIQYDHLTMQNSSRFVGVDLMKTMRFEPEHHGGVWELGFGPRYFQFHDRFHAEGVTNIISNSFFDGTIILPQAPPNIVSVATRVDVPAAPNFWDLGIDNNLVGPEMSARWSLERERWTVSADFRAMLAANFQNAQLSGATSAGYTTDLIRLDTGAVVPGTHTQTGVIGDALFTFNNATHVVTFAPLGELRVDAIYRVTHNVNIEVGYTGLLMSGVGRASQRLQYTIPNMDIVNGADKQHVFINGVNFGFNVNY